jgi:N-acetylmuramoyl-L-alanine amidase
VLDPAHGGSDTGARAASVVESEIVLDFARAIRPALESQGIRVLVTRDGNQAPTFDDRSSLVNGLRDAIFISLHIASTGPVGTVRAYSYPAIATPPAVSPTGRLLAQSRSDAARPALVPWDRAQESHLVASRRLAELLQIQLAQKFRGSPDVPQTAAVRQLRTIAAPAVAIEVSSVAVSDATQLRQMARPLADAVARAVVDFRPAAGPAPASGGAPGPGGER